MIPVVFHVIFNISLSGLQRTILCSWFQFFMQRKIPGVIHGSLESMLFAMGNFKEVVFILMSSAFFVMRQSHKASGSL